MTNKTSYIKDITEDLIEEYIKRFNDEESTDVEAVQVVFDRFNNSSTTSIIIKTIVLNNRYSAGLNDRKSPKKNIAIDVESMSFKLKEYFEKHTKTEIDTITIWRHIDDMCNSIVREGKKKPISFLSKYFHWTYIKNENIQVPIFDRYSKGMIYYLNKKYGYIDNLTQNDVKNSTYEEFCNYYIDVLTQLNKSLSKNYSVTEFDKFIWKYAKHLKKGEKIDITID